MRRPVHIVLVSGFVVVLGIWTYLLITPQPVPEKLFDGVSWFDKEMLIFLLAKATHLCVYAGFAVGVMVSIFTRSPEGTVSVTTPDPIAFNSFNQQQSSRRGQ